MNGRYKRVEVVRFKPSEKKRDACLSVGNESYFFEKVVERDKEKA